MRKNVKTPASIATSRKSPKHSAVVRELLPAIPLRDLVPFPGNELSFHVGREFSVAAIDTGQKKFVLLSQLDPDVDAPTEIDCFRMATVAELLDARVLEKAKEEPKVIGVTFRPIRRVHVHEFVNRDPYISVSVQGTQESAGPGASVTQLQQARELYVQLASVGSANAASAVLSLFGKGHYKRDFPGFLESNEPGQLADSIAARAAIPMGIKLELLGKLDKTERLLKLSEVMQQQLNVQEFEKDLNEKVREATKREHREIFLQEQLKQVLNELGERAPVHFYEPIFMGRRFVRNPKLVFVLMPFQEGFRPIYDEVIKPAVIGADLQCVRADDLYGPKAIVEDIWKSINEAQLIIADLSGKNPNVFYEVGLAHAIGKDVVFISQSVDDVPFDLRHLRCIVYTDSVAGFRKLERGLKETLAGYSPTKEKAQ